MIFNGNRSVGEILSLRMRMTCHWNQDSDIMLLKPKEVKNGYSSIFILL